MRTRKNRNMLKGGMDPSTGRPYGRINVPFT